MLTVRTIYASILAASGALVLAAAAPAFAQAIQPQPQVRPPVLPPQQPGNPQTTIPEKIDPPLRKDDTTGSTGPTLSDQLEGSKGVIKPPANVDPDMRVPAPDVGRTPVIPPPGTPGGNQDVQPK
jgi:hypothetical protein